MPYSICPDCNCFVHWQIKIENYDDWYKKADEDGGIRKILCIKCDPKYKELYEKIKAKHKDKQND